MKSGVLHCLAEPHSAELSLVCFAHAGGGSSRFRPWPRSLNGCANIYAALLPGREGKLLEVPMSSVNAVAVQVVRELSASPGRGIALAGISFGALIAFEVASLLAGRGSAPQALFVASQRGPRRDGEAYKWHLLDDDELMSKLVEIGGVDARDATDPEFKDLFLTAIRADLLASETYRPSKQPSLHCPIFVYRGRHDPVVSHDDCRAWQVETSSPVRMRTLDGGHFLMDEVDDLWLSALRADLAEVCSTGPMRQLES